MVGDSSGSSGYSHSPSSCYSDRDARRFKAERDETRRELGDVSKKTGIAELEWEHQHKQHHCSVIAADRDAELNSLKTLVKKLADKVNAPGDTPEAHLGAVEDRVDEVALHGVRLGTTLGLAAMETHTGVDYTTRSRGFHGGAKEDIDDIEVILERLDGHGDAITDSIHPQSVLNRLFD
jgi:hypothetical protein